MGGGGAGGGEGGRAEGRGETAVDVIGESAFAPPGDIGSGFVVFNRHSIEQQPDSCARAAAGGWASQVLE